MTTELSVSIYKGRTIKEKTNMTGTTHGSIIEINGQWYVFYHRLTHKSDYSRQACAEKINIDKDGTIQQVEITSCGLNDGPLTAKQGDSYPAVIACTLTNGHMPHGCNSIYQIEFPNVTNCGDDRFIAEIEDGTLIGYKYFEFNDVHAISVTARIETDENKVVYAGPVRIDDRCKDENNNNDIQAAANKTVSPTLEIRLSENGVKIGEISIGNSTSWAEYKTNVDIPDGKHPLYFTYHGTEKIQLKDISF